MKNKKIVKPVTNKGQLFPFERNGLSSILFFQSIFVPLDGSGHAGHQLGQSLLVNASLAQHTESTANFSRRRTTHCVYADTQKNCCSNYFFFPIGNIFLKLLVRFAKKNCINLVRDLITAAVEDAAGLWALMGRGGNRISVMEDRCPRNPNQPTGICRYNQDLNRRQSLSVPTPYPKHL